MATINESYRAGWLAFRSLSIYNPKGHDEAEYARGWNASKFPCLT